MNGRPERRARRQHVWIPFRILSRHLGSGVAQWHETTSGVSCVSKDVTRAGISGIGVALLECADTFDAETP